MYSSFLNKVRGIVSFEETHGVPPRMTPLGFPLPDYATLGVEAGMDLWETHYGETAKAKPDAIPFSTVSDVSTLPPVER